MSTAVKTSDANTKVVRSRHEHVDVDRRVAKYWLDRNLKHNRKAKPRKIKTYANDMLTPGGWVDTGDAIKITADGMMADGGQRMRAVLLAAETNPDIVVDMVFAFDVADNTIYVTDTGATRTFSDGLEIKERVNRNNLGAVVRRVWLWDHGNFIGTAGGSNTTFADPSMRQLHAFEESDPEQLAAATSRGLDIRRAGIGNATAAGAAYYILHRIDPEEAKDFFDHLVKGANLPEGSPVLALRDKLKTAHQSVNPANRLTATQQLWLIFRAWNGFRRDESLTALILPPNRSMINSRFIKPI